MLNFKKRGVGICLSVFATGLALASPNLRAASIFAVDSNRPTVTSALELGPDSSSFDREMSRWSAVSEYPDHFQASLARRAQVSSKSDDYFLSDKDYWIQYWTDAKSLVTAPTRWDGGDWLKFSMVIGGTLGLMMADQEIQEWVRENKNETSDVIIAAGNIVGEPLSYIPALFATYFYGKSTGDLRLRRASLLALESLAIAQLINVPFKHLVQRERPENGNSNAWHFSGPGGEGGWDGTSMPSGHAIAAYSIATVFAMEYREKPWVAVAAYGLATLVGATRVYDDHHWTSDVFIGAAIGTAVGYLVYRNSQKRAALMVMPDIRKDHYGLVFIYQGKPLAPELRE